MPDTPNVPVYGTKEEVKTFTDVNRHYQIAAEDLAQRRTDFDKKDVLFRSHITEAGWPYQSMVFDPRIFTAIFEKTSRTFANKPRGRLIPREGADMLKAKICNEILSFQWDDNSRVDGTPMIAKWAQMDMNCRKYGASFGLVKWRYQKQFKMEEGEGKKKPSGSSLTIFDGPDFVPLANRDCLPNPSYSTIKNWFQVREYVTFQELEATNDAARTAPIYKHLDELRMRLRNDAKKGGDTREANYQSKNKTIKGLTDYLGRDEVFRTIELVTEYRPDRWITFSPKHGIVLRDIPNPYKNQEIPVVMLKYYPIDDDLYGLSEIEPVERLQKAINAYVNQNLDTLNMSTYTPIKVRSTSGAVQMHTLEFGPGKKWLMNDPATDVIPFESNPQGIAEFVPTYRLMVAAMQEALGETSAAVSSMEPGQSDKTATEVRDLAASRSARDNFNQIFLSEALKRQMLFWHVMDQQFLFSDPTQQQKVIRIVGKDALAYFQGQGLDGEALTDEAIDLLGNPDLDTTGVDPMELQQPLYPVNVGGEIVPKLTMDEDNQGGTMIVEPDDLTGLYDYVPDVESMSLPNDAQLVAAQSQYIEIVLNPLVQQMMVQDGYKIKIKEMLEDFGERLKIKDADKYFEKLQPQMLGGVDANGNPLPPGTGGPQAGQQGMGNGGAPGIPGAVPPVPGGEAQPSVPGPV